MPTYCYKKPDGTITELVMTVAEMSERQTKSVIEIDGEACKRIYTESGITGSASNSGWPIYSEAAGCHPTQVKEFTEFDRKHGVNTKYTQDGRAIFRDSNHRKRHLKAHGTFDRCSYN